ncbi:MAG: hypothetical protein OK452_11390 [Thaumarchaeota archaeon]|nr:hypothetical protein [Nitrososphaerota archaeon]
MRIRKLHRSQAIRAGLILWGLALILGFASGTLGALVGASVYGPFSPFVLTVPLGLVGFALLIASTFLPSSRSEKPNFTQELMGRENLNYGVYTEGNWISVLDEKKKEEESNRRR